MRMAGDDSEFDHLMSNSVNPSDDDTEPNMSVLEHMSKLGLDRDQVQLVCVIGDMELQLHFWLGGDLLKQGIVCYGTWR